MRTLWSAVVILVLSAAAPRPAPAAGVAWHEGSFATALEAAASSNRPLMVDVFATWCGPCHELDRVVFSRDDVGAEAASYIAVRVDAEAGEGPALTERYHVVGYPTVLFLAPDGTEIDRIFGFAPPADFLDAMRGYREGKGTLAEKTELAKKRPLDLELALELGTRYAVRGDETAAKRHFGRIFAARRMVQGVPHAGRRGAADVARLGRHASFRDVRRGVDEDLSSSLEYIDGLLAQVHLVLGKYLYLRGHKDYPRAMEILTELRHRYPDSPEARQVPYQMAVALQRSGETEKARAEIARYYEANERSAGAANTVAWFCYRERDHLEWGQSVAEEALVRHPDEAALWDTLAELRLVRGDAEGAVAAIREAARLDPDEAYYQGQLKRFLASEADARKTAASEATAAGESPGG